MLLVTNALLLLSSELQSALLFVHSLLMLVVLLMLLLLLVMKWWGLLMLHLLLPSPFFLTSSGGDSTQLFVATSELLDPLVFCWISGRHRGQPDPSRFFSAPSMFGLQSHFVLTTSLFFSLSLYLSLPHVVGVNWNRSWSRWWRCSMMRWLLKVHPRCTNFVLTSFTLVDSHQTDT